MVKIFSLFGSVINLIFHKILPHAASIVLFLIQQTSAVLDCLNIGDCSQVYYLIISLSFKTILS